MIIDPVSKGTAILCLVLNVVLIFPVGTMVHTCYSEHCWKSFIVGLVNTTLMFVQGMFSYAWSFSVFYGILILISSRLHEKRSYNERLIQVNQTVNGAIAIRIQDSPYRIPYHPPQVNITVNQIHQE